VHYERYSNDPITHALVSEVRAERNLMQRCIDEFYQRRIRADQVNVVDHSTLGVAQRMAARILEKIGAKQPMGESDDEERIRQAQARAKAKEEL